MSPITFSKITNITYWIRFSYIAIYLLHILFTLFIYFCESGLTKGGLDLAFNREKNFGEKKQENNTGNFQITILLLFCNAVCSLANRNCSLTLTMLEEYLLIAYTYCYDTSNCFNWYLTFHWRLIKYLLTNLRSFFVFITRSYFSFITPVWIVWM